MVFLFDTLLQEFGKRELTRTEVLNFIQQYKLSINIFYIFVGS